MGGQARAVLINSGQANACTGDRGLIDSQRATQVLADRLGLNAEAVLICSTGVIGVPIPMEVLLVGLDPLVEALNAEGGAAAAKAILTTDLVEKETLLKRNSLAALCGLVNGQRFRDDPSRHGHHARVHHL